jgi:hypothetical protein
MLHSFRLGLLLIRAVCASQHSSPLLYRALSANLILSCHSDSAWFVTVIVITNQDSTSSRLLPGSYSLLLVCLAGRGAMR